MMEVEPENQDEALPHRASAGSTHRFTLRRIVLWNLSSNRRASGLCWTPEEFDLETFARVILSRWDASENTFKHLADYRSSQAIDNEGKNLFDFATAPVWNARRWLIDALREYYPKENDRVDLCHRRLFRRPENRAFWGEFWEVWL